MRGITGLRWCLIKAMARTASRTASARDCRVEERRNGVEAGPMAPVPLPGHQAGGANLPHPTFRQSSCQAYDVRRAPAVCPGLDAARRASRTISTDFENVSRRTRCPRLRRPLTFLHRSSQSDLQRAPRLSPNSRPNRRHQTKRRRAAIVRPRLSGLRRIPSVRAIKPEGPQGIDLTRSPSRQSMTGICASRPFMEPDRCGSNGFESGPPIRDPRKVPSVGF